MVFTDRNTYFKAAVKKESIKIYDSRFNKGIELFYTFQNLYKKGYNKEKVKLYYKKGCDQ